MLMGLFQGSQARRRRPTSSVDAIIRRVTAGIWSEVGATYGLELATEPELTLRGTVREVLCEITLVGEGAATFTLANGIHDRSLGGRLAVAPVSFGRSVAARLTGSRVQTGDREFDEGFVILSEPASFASTFLNDDMRAGLLAMRLRNPHVSVGSDAVTIELEGTEMVHENLHAIVGILSRGS